jgi:hypothetical protein
LSYHRGQSWFNVTRTLRETCLKLPTYLIGQSIPYPP